MAGNRFATMLHRNTNKFVVVLVYTLLEWILIALLLFNSLLSYLIYRFSSYFGLKKPCLFCSRLDHLSHSDTNACFSHARFLCDHHCAQISMLAYCYDHRKLADATHMCPECHSSRLNNHNVLLTTDRPLDHLRCSCCHAQIETDSMPKPNPIPQNQPSSESGPQAESPSAEPTSGVNTRVTNNNSNNTASIPDSNSHILHQYQLIEPDNTHLLAQATLSLRNKLISSYSTHEIDDDEFTTNSRKEIMDPFHDLIAVFGDIEDNHLEEEVMMAVDEEQDKIQASQQDVPTCSETESRADTDNETESRADNETEVTIGSEICDNELIPRFHFSPSVDQAKCQANPFMDPATTSQVYQSCIPNDLFEKIQEPVSPLSHQIEICDETEDNNGQSSEIENTLDNNANYQDSTKCEFHYQEQLYVNQFQVQFSPLVAQFDHCKEMKVVEHNEASEETNKPDVKMTTTTTTQEDQNNGPQLHDSLLDLFSDFDGSKDVCIEAGVRSGVLEIGTANSSSLTNVENHELSSIHTENNEIADDRTPETPKSVEDICILDRKCVFDKRENSTESVDGSVASEFDFTDVSTVDQLKSALKDERRALNALYGELEEERSASSIAANQTMAMITRLQQEKASMQMEALHYQRMMEEQSEYDQEALQLLNDLVMKKEKEKQELEKELEMYRKRDGFYESKEKNIKCCLDSTIEMGGDNDTCLDLTTEMGGDPNESEDSETNHSASVHVLSTTHELDSLEDSLADFEEERISILENLGVLVEKLFTMDASVEDYNEEDDSAENGTFLLEGNYCEDRDYFKRNHRSSKGKQLLPLFDAALSNNRNFSCNHQDVGSEQNKYGLIEEMDLVYKRLQTLEADREFLKHSIKSMNNGNEGMALLQEILQHLRDLRNSELHIRDSSNHLSSFSF